MGTCSLCGQAIANGESKKVEVIDGSPYVFDTYSCVAMFSFIHYSDAIISIINESYQKCSIALYGEWGTYKTTLMKWELIRSYFPRY